MSNILCVYMCIYIFVTLCTSAGSLSFLELLDVSVSRALLTQSEVDDV